MEEVRNTPRSPAEAASLYDMRMVLDGTILAQGDNLRLTARLTDAVAGRVVWSQTWDGTTEDIFAWEDNIYEQIVWIIATEWTGVLSQEALSRTKTRSTESFDAFELCLLGSAEKHKFTQESLERAEGYLKQAIAIDPKFAKAWASLDITYLYLGDYAETAAVNDDFYAASRDAKIRAYEADPDDPYVLIRYASYLSGREKESEAAEP